MSWRRAYVTSAVVVLNALLAFAFLNLLAWPLAKGRPSDPVGKYGLDRLRRAYPGWRDEDIRALAAESFVGFRLVYHPLVGFKNGPFRGRFVNTEALGYRRSEAGAQDPASPGGPRVFLFGGSTAFGLGVSDEETIAAALQRELRRRAGSPAARVFNFGTPAYFSSQELALFADLLRSGVVPETAVFLDGLNEFFYADGRPEFSFLFEHTLRGDATYDLLYELPLARLALTLKQELAREPGGDAPGGTPAVALERWRRNRRLIEALGGAHGVRTIFVWQPVPTYRYDLDRHFLHDGSPGFFEGHQRSAEGYRLAEEAWRRDELGGPVLWLSGIQERELRNLYVDTVHYNAEFSRELGERIARFLVESGSL